MTSRLITPHTVTLLIWRSCFLISYPSQLSFPFCLWSLLTNSRKGFWVGDRHRVDAFDSAISEGCMWEFSWIRKWEMGRPTASRLCTNEVHKASGKALLHLSLSTLFFPDFFFSFSFLTRHPRHGVQLKYCVLVFQSIILINKNIPT